MLPNCSSPASGSCINYGSEALPKHLPSRHTDGYTVDHSSGLPYHSQLGLLEAGLVEKKNLVLINTYLEMTRAQGD